MTQAQSPVQPLHLAVAAAKAGNPALAKMQLQKAAEAAPNDPAVWLWMGWLADSPASAAQSLEVLLNSNCCTQRYRDLAETGIAFMKVLNEFQFDSDVAVPADALLAEPDTGSDSFSNGNRQSRQTQTEDCVENDSASVDRACGERTKVDSACVEAAMEPNELQSNELKSNDLQSNELESNELQSSGLESKELELSGLELSGLESGGSQAAGFEAVRIESAGPQAAGGEIAGGETAGIEAADSEETRSDDGPAWLADESAAEHAGAVCCGWQPFSDQSRQFREGQTETGSRRDYLEGPDHEDGIEAEDDDPAEEFVFAGDEQDSTSEPPGLQDSYCPELSSSAESLETAMAPASPGISNHSAETFSDEWQAPYFGGFKHTDDVPVGNRPEDRSIHATDANALVLSGRAEPAAGFITPDEVWQSAVVEKAPMDAVAERVEQPVAERVEQPVAERVEQPVAECVEQPVERPIEQPLSPAAEVRSGRDILERWIVLVVDDSPEVRKLAAMTLEKRGCRVVTAVDGVAAIKEIAAHRPALILMDVNMPRLDGYQLCKLVKKHESTSDIPVVMLTGKDGMFDRLRGRLVGCSGYLAKPLTPEDLLTTVDEHLKFEV